MEKAFWIIKMIGKLKSVLESKRFAVYIKGGKIEISGGTDRLFDNING